MPHTPHSQRGGSKIGCTLTLLIVAAAVAVLIKAFPVFWSNYELADACDLIATEASRFPAEQVEANVRSKAKELEIPEALKPGAIQVTKTLSGGDSGTCTITLRYKRVIDLYGVYKWEMVMDKRITKTIFTNI